MTPFKDHDDRAFDEAWRAFVEDDARLQAPAHLEVGIFRAMEAPQVVSPPSRSKHLALTAALTAAVMLAIVFVARRDSDVPSASTSTQRASGDLPPVLMTFGAAPVRDTEALQLVRVRLPREALQRLGIVLLEPDAVGVVDVDVLVGEDGIAREIRRVSTGQDQELMR